MKHCEHLAEIKNYESLSIWTFSLLIWSEPVSQMAPDLKVIV